MSTFDQSEHAPSHESGVPRDSLALDSEIDEQLIQGLTIDGYDILGN